MVLLELSPGVRHQGTLGNTNFGEMEGGGRVLTLRVIGNSSNGYGVTVLFGANPVARHNSGGEFNAVFQNEERSLEDRAENWRASSWTGDETHVTLHGECTLPSMNTTVLVRVEYEVVTPKVVRKRIRPPGRYEHAVLPGD